MDRLLLDNTKTTFTSDEVTIFAPNMLMSVFPLAYKGDVVNTKTLSNQIDLYQFKKFQTEEKIKIES